MNRGNADVLDHGDLNGARTGRDNRRDLRTGSADLEAGAGESAEADRAGTDEFVPVMVTYEPGGPLIGTILTTEAICENSVVSGPVGAGTGTYSLLLDTVAVVDDVLSTSQATTPATSATADTAQATAMTGR